jgi:hypothetical protein
MPATDAIGGARPIPDRRTLISAGRAAADGGQPRNEAAPADAKADQRELRNAYERGRRDERARRRRSPLLSLLILVVAAVGGALVYLAASEGSFTRGGGVVDRAIGHVADQAKPAVNRTGDALENAGRSLKNSTGGPGQS